MKDDVRPDPMVIKRTVFRPGYLKGETSPLLIVATELLPRPFDVQQFISVLETINAERGIPHKVAAPGPELASDIPELMVRSLVYLVSAAHIPRYGVTQAARIPGGQGQQRVLFYIPAVKSDYRNILDLFAWLIQLLLVTAEFSVVDDSLALGNKIFDRLKRQAPSGVNAFHQIPAAVQLDVPWCALIPTVYQFGWGWRSRLMQSTMTDATPAISVNTARQKPHTSALLRAAGLPVAVHRVVMTEEDAIKATEKLGFPVAVKPLTQDRGDGVSAGIDNEAALRKAVQYAQQYEKEIMVQQHIPGEDYRFQVAHGEVVWAVQRVPPVLTGNGLDNVTELLNQYNAMRGQIEDAALKALVLDSEALGVLQDQMLKPESVPDRGQKVRLRRIANVSGGAIPVPVLDKVHPDNLALIESVARVMRLDLAGIDFIMPDIEKSWHDVGGAICEVNAQPQFWPTLHSRVLSRMMEGDGRIPVVFILSAPDLQPDLSDLITALEGLIPGLGVATDREVRLCGKLVSRQEMTIYERTRALVTNTETRVILAVSRDTTLAQQGIAVDRLNALFFCPDFVSTEADRTADDRKFVNALVGLCQGDIYVPPSYRPPGRLPAGVKLRELAGDRFVANMTSIIEQLANE